MWNRISIARQIASVSMLSPLSYISLSLHSSAVYISKQQQQSPTILPATVPAGSYISLRTLFVFMNAAMCIYTYTSIHPQCYPVRRLLCNTYNTYVIVYFLIIIIIPYVCYWWYMTLLTFWTIILYYVYFILLLYNIYESLYISACLICLCSDQ